MPTTIPPPGSTSPAKTTPQSSSKPTLIEGVNVKAHKAVVYAAGGLGKTELCSANVKKLGLVPLVLDLDDESKFLDVKRYNIQTFDELRAVIHDESVWKGIDVAVVDSFTRAEELAAEWVIRNVKHEKGKFITSIEDYGFGKGYTHIYEAFLLLLGDLDGLVRKGIHVLCTAHDCAERVPNAEGEDYLQYQPRLQSPNKQGKIRERVKEWCDHMLHIDFDTHVTDGKVQGSGSRTIYAYGTPTRWAKSRMGIDPVVYEKGSAKIWEMILQGKSQD